ncbi:MAG: hypothetical protein WAL22_19185 [Solirubrobacteraceae bacterium]
MKLGPIVAVGMAAVGCLAGCGGSGARSPAPKAVVTPSPVMPCSLLTARQVSQVLGVHIRVQRAPSFCTYQGTRNHVFRAVVVTPLRVTAAARPIPFQSRYGPIVRIAGRGYRGQAQNDQPSLNGASSDQAKAQVVSGTVLVRLLVTYHDPALRQVSQVHEVATLADQVGTRLARAQ